MESQPQNPEFRNNPENFHPCRYMYATGLAGNLNLVWYIKHSAGQRLNTKGNVFYTTLIKRKKILISIYWPRGYKTFIHAISTAHKKLKYRKVNTLLALSLSDVVFFILINVKMPTIVGILTFMSRINFVLS